MFKIGDLVGWVQVPNEEFEITRMNMDAARVCIYHVQSATTYYDVPLEDIRPTSNKSNLPTAFQVGDPVLIDGVTKARIYEIDASRNDALVVAAKMGVDTFWVAFSRLTPLTASTSPKRHACSCDLTLLMREGCKCGGV